MTQNTATLAGSSAPAEMRPSRRSRRAWTSRFLRPRGDAPTCSGMMLNGVRVPPPPRRCASRARSWARRSGGSSAPAEMRPLVGRSGRAHRRFLRPRGDAPPPCNSDRFAGSVPPPPRRCAASSGYGLAESSGSSAPAEMRPITASASYSQSRFLRPRGDAPGASTWLVIRTPVPPPPRRCALRFLKLSDFLKGSSAPAEMRPAR